MTRVLIADDDDLMRAGLVELLSGEPEIEIVGEAATGRQAVERARRLRPDVVLMDVRMPDLDGIQATRELTRAAPDTRVVILTTFEQDDYVFGALRAGASGFLLKRTRPEELIAAVRSVAAGDSLLSPSVTRLVIDRMAQQPLPELANQAKLNELTPRECEVLDGAVRRGIDRPHPRQADPDEAPAPRPRPDRDLRLRDGHEPPCRRPSRRCVSRATDRAHAHSQRRSEAEGLAHLRSLAVDRSLETERARAASAR
jgi:DNA-binding NarL/FixJ family response regulator